MIAFFLSCWSWTKKFLESFPLLYVGTCIFFRWFLHYSIWEKKQQPCPWKKDICIIYNMTISSETWYWYIKMRLLTGKKRVHKQLDWEKEMHCFLKAFILCWEFLPPSLPISCDVKADVNQKKFNKPLAYLNHMSNWALMQIQWNVHHLLFLVSV